MQGTIAIRHLALGAVLAFILSSCAAILSSAESEVAPLTKPPASWPSAIQFALDDPAVHPRVSHTTRVQFHDGSRIREVTHRDMVVLPTQDRATAWYRLRLPKQDSLTVRVILEHADGTHTVADYPLHVRKDNFYEVFAVVYTRDPDRPLWIGMPVDSRGYPLATPARAAPGDSLWISYRQISRECWSCPT